MHNAVYMGLVLVAGMCWPLQAVVNSELKTRTGQPLASAMVNGGGAAVIAGLALLVFGVLAGKLQVPLASSVQQTPWWAYLGGVFSVLVIVAQSSSAAPLGVALLVTLFVSGQAVSSLLVDHVGLLGLPSRPASLTRVLAVAGLLACAAALAFEGRSGGTPERDSADTTASPQRGTHTEPGA